MKCHVMESAYLGDLLIATHSQFSRNRTFRTMMCNGYSDKSAQIEMDMISEGYYALKNVHVRNKDLKIDLLIINEACNVVHEKISLE